LLTDSGVTQLPNEPDNPYALALTVYLRGIAVLLLILGLRHWLYIAGVFEEPGWSFETMTTKWRFATINLAVIDLVAAVGLWMRVSWGNVIWIYAACFEITLHTLFHSTFGFDVLVLVFHILALAGFVALVILEKRYEASAGGRR